MGRALRLGACARPCPVRRAGHDRRLSSAATTAFDHAMGAFAETYADQTERDFATFSAAIASGRIAAQSGV